MVGAILQRNHEKAKEKEIESACGTMGRGKRGRQMLVSRLFRLPIVHRAHFLIVAIFIGIPSGSLCAGERTTKRDGELRT